MKVDLVLRVNKRQLQFFWRARRAKVIFADSMPRSGSTLIFNVMRLLLESHSDCDLQSGWVRSARSLPAANTYLIKTHGLNTIDAWRASSIVYSYRDPRVALVSMLRKFNVTPSIELVRHWLRDFDFAERHADILVRYENMITDVPALVRDLAHHLHCEADSEEVADRVTHMTARNNASYEVSLFHAGHQTGTRDDEWRYVLPESLQAQIASEFAPWLERHSYPLM